MSHRNCVYEIPGSEFRSEAGLEFLSGSRWHLNPRTCWFQALAFGQYKPWYRLHSFSHFSLLQEFRDLLALS